MPMTSSNQGSLVAHVSNVRSAETRSLTSKEIEIEVVSLLDRPQVNIEDSLTLAQLRQVHMNLTVKTSGTQQRRIKDVSTIRSSQDNHTTIRAKTVHLRQQLVESILAFIIATHRKVFRTRTPHSINLIDKDDTRSLVLSLSKKVTHTTRAHADEHLYKVRAAHREERYISLACHSLGQQGLARARRPYEQCALRNLTT